MLTLENYSPTELNLDEKGEKGVGLFQVLWERGLIDETKLLEYKLPAKDEDGDMIPEFSLLHLMGNCTDFKNTISQ